MVIIKSFFNLPGLWLATRSGCGDDSRTQDIVCKYEIS